MRWISPRTPTPVMGVLPFLCQAYLACRKEEES